MNTKILLSLLTIGIASASVGYGTFAYFSSEKTSAENIFTSGTLSLNLGGALDTDAFIGSTNFAPGESVTGSLSLVNAGSIGGSKVSLDLKGIAKKADGSSSPLAPYLIVEELKYGSVDLLAGRADAAGGVTLAELGASVIKTGLADPGAGTTLSMKVKFDPNAGNDVQGETAVLKFTFLLRQVDGTAMTI